MLKGCKKFYMGDDRVKLEDMINTIQLGNCYELIKDIPDKSIDLIYTDIPYLINGVSASDEEKTKKKIQEYREKMINATSKSEYEKYHCLHSNLLNKRNLKTADIANGIDYKILDEFVRISKYIYIYIWCSKEQIYDLMKYFIEKQKCNMNILTWCKTNCVPATNNNFLPNMEYCLVFKQKGAPKYNDGYELKSKWYISSQNKSDKDKYEHPTIKPLELVKRHILHSTQPDDIVLDCFCGSGTTCVAAKETGRRFIGMEIDSQYHKIAVDRLNGINANGQTSIFTDFENIGDEK